METCSSFRSDRGSSCPDQPGNGEWYGYRRFRRSGNFLPRQISELPLIGLNPISLARTLPGVTQTSGGFNWGSHWAENNFAINGQRNRGNNFLLDGADNNDLHFTGPAQPFSIAD